MKELREFSTRLEFVQDTINYYWGKPQRTNATVDRCLYMAAHSLTDGCAIGRWLPDETCRQLDELPDGTLSNDEAWALIPDWMKLLGRNFLIRIQEIHDGNGFKNKDKLFIGSLSPYIDIHQLTFPDETTNDIQG